MPNNVNNVDLFAQNSKQCSSMKSYHLCVFLFVAITAAGTTPLEDSQNEDLISKINGQELIAELREEINAPEETTGFKIPTLVDVVDDDAGTNLEAPTTLTLEAKETRVDLGNLLPGNWDAQVNAINDEDDAVDDDGVIDQEKISTLANKMMEKLANRFLQANANDYVAEDENDVDVN